MGFGIGVSGSGMGPRGALDHFASGEDTRGKVFDKKVVARLVTFLRPYSRQMILAFFAMLFVSGFTLLTPYLLKIAIDQYITQGDQQGLIRISLYTAAAFVGLFVASAAQQYLLSWIGQNMLANLRNGLFKHLQSSPSAITIHTLLGLPSHG